MVDYEETRENAILSLEQQIKQLVKDAFDKGYQCGYKDRKDEPKRGEWKISNLPKGEMKYCSECGFGQYIKDERMYNFCPNCGADMREREGE